MIVRLQKATPKCSFRCGYNC